MDERSPEVNATWAQTRLDRVATVNARIGWKALTSAEYQDDGYAFLATPNIKSEAIDFEHVNYISQFRYDESPELMLRAGDVLLAKDGSTLGIANVVRYLPRPATVNGSIAVLRTFAMEPRYLMYALRSNPLQEWIAQVKDGMGVPHLFQADIKKFSIPNPSAGTQRRIADFLDDQVARIDNIIACRSAQSAAITVLFEREWAARWEALAREHGVARAAYLLVGMEQGWSPEAEARRAGADEWAVMRAGCLNGGILDAGDHKALPAGLEPRRQYEIRPGDLLMSRASGSRDLIGSVAVTQPGTRSRLLLPDKIYRLLPDQTKATASYLAVMLRSPAARERIAIGISGAEGMANNLPAPVIKSIPIPAVPRAFQDGIVSEYEGRRETAVSQTMRLSGSNALLTELKQSLITAAVTGEFDVSSADGSQVPA